MMLSPITEINAHKFRPFRYKRRKQIRKMSEYISRIIKVCKILMIKSLTEAVNVDLKRTYRTPLSRTLLEFSYQ